MKMHSNRTRILLLMVATLLLSAWHVNTTQARQGTAPTAKTLYQQGLYEEEASGNLKAAIALYERVLSAKPDRALTAEALLRMAGCYQKLGDSESRKVYQRIVDEFADQKEVAADAGRRLAALRATPITHAPLTRLVMTPGDRYDTTSVSVDGRSMAVVRRLNDTGARELAVQDISTGEFKHLLLAACPTQKTCAYPGEAVLSPDSKQVAYTWEGSDQQELRIVANEAGAKPRVLVSNPEWNMYSLAWAPDGKSILVAVLHNGDRNWQLTSVSTVDGASKVLKSLQWRVQLVDGVASFSPDGRYIAYAVLATNPKQPAPTAADSPDMHIYVLAADGSETEVVKTAGANRIPVWTPDGAHIVFTSNLSGKTDLWSVTVRDGKADGSPSLVMKDVGNIRPAGMTRSGAFYFRKTTEGVEQASVVELAPGGMSRVVESFVGINPTWSPDGKSVAFKRHSTKFNDAFDVVVRSPAVEERVFTNTGINNANPPRWLHKKTGFLTIADDAWQFVDLQNGTFTQVAQRGPLRSAVAALAPEDKTLYFGSRDPGSPNAGWDHITALDLQTLQATSVFEFPEAVEVGRLAIAVSPDGRTLAISHRVKMKDRVALVHVDGSDYHEICAFNASSVNDKLVWTKDGRAILFAVPQGNQNSDWRIMRIGIGGGKPEFTGLTVKALGTFDLSPDGTRIAFSTLRSGTATEELLVLENLPVYLKVSK